MKSFDQLSEDLATRRAELKQRQREQGARFKTQGAERACCWKNRKHQLLLKRTADDSRASLDRIKQMAAQRRAAAAERKAKQQERENISKEIAASREQKQSEIKDKKQDREEIRKSREEKRMDKRKEEGGVTEDT